MNEYIQQMIDWIEEHIKESFSLDELAEFMGYSPYYCSFKFHQATGVSIRRYLLLRRLYLSLGELVRGKKVIDVAFEYGYTSQEAYSRAFKSIFGLSPGEYQLKQPPVQSFVKLIFNKRRGAERMDVTKEVEDLQRTRGELFDEDVLNILNGQMMYEEFKTKKLMGNSDYVPFNEAMCVHPTTRKIFDDEFIQIRAASHHDTIEHYTELVIDSLEPLFRNQYNYIVLWFGEDVFCQMNLLTLLAYLEQAQYKGRVFLNSFRDDEFKVNQTELQLGSYSAVYEGVLIHHQKPTATLLPVMYQAVELYLSMQNENNEVAKYIKNNGHLSTEELVKQLITLFPTLGFGDLQYIEIINKLRN